MSARRNIIINFISCCPDEEVSIFINLITGPFKLLCHGECFADTSLMSFIFILLEVANIYYLKMEVGEKEMENEE